MKGPPLLLFCLALPAFPGTARALLTDTVFRITVPDGPDPTSGTDVGSLFFTLDVDAAGPGCRYLAVWDDTTGQVLEGTCHVDEHKTRRHTSCFTNSQTTFVTLVEKSPDTPCVGFDTTATPRDLFLLVGLEVEIGSVPGIIGLVQWTAAATFVSPFEARRYP